MKKLILFWDKPGHAGGDVSLRLFREARGPHGMVYPPRRGAPFSSAIALYGPLEAVTAVQKALALASRYDCDIVVEDPDHCWHFGWGELRRGDRNPRPLEESRAR